MPLFYTHELDREVRSISGGYELDKEERVEYNGNEVLYIVGNAVVDSSCCGYGGCRYAIVPGFVVRWKAETNDRGLPVTEVEPIRGEKEKREIREMIMNREVVTQIEFW